MAKAKNALSISDVPVDAYCVGGRWVVDDIQLLGRLIAIVAMGQAAHAAKIVEALQPASPKFTHAKLIAAAKKQLQIVGASKEKKDASRWHRDGFIFEVISWIATHQTKGQSALVRDPHLKSTIPGLDGLMIELDKTGKHIKQATIFEDKCSEYPRKKFHEEVMPAFSSHHENLQSQELVATAASLIEKSGLDGSSAVEAAARVLDLNFRKYQAALTIEKDCDSQKKRAVLFEGYADLKTINKEQRVGATFIVDGGLRDYFDTLAASAVAELDAWDTSAHV